MKQPLFINLLLLSLSSSITANAEKELALRTFESLRPYISIIINQKRFDTNVKIAFEQLIKEIQIKKLDQDIVLNHLKNLIDERLFFYDQKIKKKLENAHQHNQQITLLTAQAAGSLGFIFIINKYLNSLNNEVQSTENGLRDQNVFVTCSNNRYAFAWGLSPFPTKESVKKKLTDVIVTKNWALRVRLFGFCVAAFLVVKSLSDVINFCDEFYSDRYYAKFTSLHKHLELVLANSSLDCA